MKFWPSSWIPLIVAAFLGGCGYHVSGKGELLPKNDRTIAIPAFQNLTTRAQLADKIPEALAREFIARTHYVVVSDPAQADLVLTGAVTRYQPFVTIVDQATGRASAMQASVVLQLTLTERATGKVVFSRPLFETHQRYQISITSAKAYFDESETAIANLSRDVARDIVSAILENF